MINIKIPRNEVFIYFSKLPLNTRVAHDFKTNRRGKHGIKRKVGVYIIYYIISDPRVDNSKTSVCSGAAYNSAQTPTPIKTDNTIGILSIIVSTITAILTVYDPM